MEEEDCMVFKKSILSVVCAVGVCGVVQGADRTPERRQPQSCVPPHQKALHAGDEKAVARRLLHDLYAAGRHAWDAGNLEQALVTFQSLQLKIAEYNHSYAMMVTVDDLVAEYISPAEPEIGMDIDTGAETEEFICGSSSTESDSDE
jgi:hypothetical protein